MNVGCAYTICQPHGNCQKKWWDSLLTDVLFWHFVFVLASKSISFICWNRTCLVYRPEFDWMFWITNKSIMNSTAVRSSVKNNDNLKKSFGELKTLVLKLPQTQIFGQHYSDAGKWTEFLYDIKIQVDLLGGILHVCGRYGGMRETGSIWFLKCNRSRSTANDGQYRKCRWKASSIRPKLKSVRFHSWFVISLVRSLGF